MIFVVDRKDSILRYQSGSIRVELDNHLVQRVPISQLALVVVYGNPLAETAVWRNLAAAQVPSVMLNSRGKSQVAMLGSGLATQLPLRINQHQLAGSHRSKLQMARWFVDKKIAAYEIPLSILCKQYQVDGDAFINLSKTTQNKLLQAENNASLMGLEGQHAHAWFQLLADSLPRRWRFDGRNRRPPQDPVNALLSLSYTLMMSEARQCLISFGFDPSLGFLHQQVAGREALVLDFAELFRAAVDYFVLQCLADKILTPEHFFYRQQTGCQLSKEARGIYYKAWAIFRNNWPVTSHKQGSEKTRLRELMTRELMQLREFMHSGINTDERHAIFPEA